MSGTVCGSIHKWFILFNVFVLIPFGVSCKKTIFIDAFANIRGFELCFKCKSDWKVVFHPLIVYGSELLQSFRSCEYKIMINFKHIRTKEFSTSCFIRGANIG